MPPHLVVADSAGVGVVHDARQLALGLSRGQRRGREGGDEEEAGRTGQAPAARGCAAGAADVEGAPRGAQAATARRPFAGEGGWWRPRPLTISMDMGSSSGSTVMELGMSITFSYLMIWSRGGLARSKHCKGLRQIRGGRAAAAAAPW